MLISEYIWCYMCSGTRWVKLEHGAKAAILSGKGTKEKEILVLDEATASIDNATCAIIQETIRREFEGCTVTTVA